MIGMRNRLVHVYFDINMDIVRLTVVKFVPDLIPSLERLFDESS